MNNILVSICIITYNQEKYIAEALNSFLIQKTDFDFEILIHDDASTDKTPQIIKEYEEKYPNIIKPIYQTENKYSKGVSVDLAYNFPRAKGKYIAVCEGDDYWIDRNKLQIQIDYMEKHPQCALCVHAAYKVGVRNTIKGQIRVNKKDTNYNITNFDLIVDNVLK
jgi:glycosyltransferase involved in cell wall biosynthesis